MRTRTWTVLGAGALTGAVAVTVPALSSEAPQEGLGGPVVVDPSAATRPPPSAAVVESPVATRAPSPAAIAPPAPQPVVVRPAPPRTVQRPLPPAADSPESADSPDD